VALHVMNSAILHSFAQ